MMQINTSLFLLLTFRISQSSCQETEAKFAENSIYFTTKFAHYKGIWSTKIGYVIIIEHYVSITSNKKWEINLAIAKPFPEK